MTPDESERIEPSRLDLRRDVDDVAHDREQELVDAANDAPIDERFGRRIAELELDAAILLQDLDVEIGILLEDRARIVVVAALRQYRKRATTQQLVQTTPLASRKRATSWRESTSSPAAGEMRALNVGDLRGVSIRYVVRSEEKPMVRR